MTAWLRSSRIAVNLDRATALEVKPVTRGGGYALVVWADGIPHTFATAGDRLDLDRLVADVEAGEAGEVADADQLLHELEGPAGG